MTALFRLLTLALALIAGSSALAQDKSAFIASFSGKWFVFDPAIGANGKTCAINLSKDENGDTGQHVAKASDCAAPLSGLAAWDIHDGQLQLLAADGSKPIAVLGGSQHRITGTFSANGNGLIVERAQGDETTRALAAAVAHQRCIYLGFTDKCAPAPELARPTPAKGADTTGVQLLVNLNVRGQPRGDAPVIGKLPEGTCLKVNFCAVASDGIWCRARFGDRSGWVHKTALRQKEWPALTFTNSCTAPK